MATSGSVNFNVTRNEIITEALELIGAISAGDTPAADDVTSCARTLNMMIKHWQARGVALWKNSSIYLFLDPSEDSYTIGPTGDYATTSMVKTEVSTAASSGASTVLVDSITGIASADIIGVELDDGTLHWTTVNGAPSGSTITLTAALTDDVNVDAHVYAYTTITNRPLFISDASLMLNSGVETPVEVVSRRDFSGISLKTVTGKATQVYYDPQTTNGVLSVWPTADSVKDYLILTARMPLEDFDAAGDNPDFPQEWLLPLAWNLAVLIAPKFDERLTPDFIGMAGQFLQDAMDSAVDYGSVIIEIE